MTKSGRARLYELRNELTPRFTRHQLAEIDRRFASDGKFAGVLEKMVAKNKLIKHGEMGPYSFAEKINLNQQSLVNAQARVELKKTRSTEAMVPISPVDDFAPPESIITAMLALNASGDSTSAASTIKAKEDIREELQQVEMNDIKKEEEPMHIEATEDLQRDPQTNEMGEDQSAKYVSLQQRMCWLHKGTDGGQVLPNQHAHFTRLKGASAVNCIHRGVKNGYLNNSAVGKYDWIVDPHTGKANAVTSQHTPSKEQDNAPKDELTQLEEEEKKLAQDKELILVQEAQIAAKKRTLLQERRNAQVAAASVAFDRLDSEGKILFVAALSDDDLMAMGLTRRPSL